MQYRDLMKKKNNLGKMIDHYFAQNGTSKPENIEPVIEKYSEITNLLSKDQRIGD